MHRGDDPEGGSDRRDFIRELAAVSVAVGAGFAWRGAIGVAQAGVRRDPSAPKDNLVGIQMGPHTMLDEGIERCLDLLQETASIDAVFIYSHAYGGDLRKPLQWLATDHGVAPRDQRARNLPLVWVRHHDRYFKDTTLRHQKIDSTYDYFDRDLFAEVVGPARKRGIKVYARILEAGPRSIENFSKVVTVNVYGKPTQTACWNHPEYKAFWNATVEDLSLLRAPPPGSFASCCTTRRSSRGTINIVSRARRS